MKKILLFTTASLCFFSLTLSAKEFKLNSDLEHKKPFVLQSLKETATDDGVKGKLMISAGVGFNFFGTLLEGRYVLNNDYYNYSAGISGHSSTPMFNVMADYGLGKRFSVGVAAGYQIAKINFRDVITPGDSYSDTWNRINLAVRGDYYIVARPKSNLYTGLKVGYNLYTAKTDLPPAYFPDYFNHMSVTPQPLCVQAHFGFSYFFNEMIGFNTEIGFGVGSPYMFAVGLAAKI